MSAVAVDDRRPIVRKVTETLQRYEIVIGTVAVIVLLTRLAGGSFTGELADDLSGLTPFTAAAPTPGGAAEPPASAPPAAPELTATAPPSFVTAPATPPATSFASSDVSATADGDVLSAPAAAPSLPTSTAGTAAFASVPAPGAPTPIAVSAGGDVWVGTDNGPGRGTDGPPAVFRYSEADGRLVATYRPEGVDRGITAIVAGESTVHLLSRAPAAVHVLNPADGSTRRLAAIPDVRPCIPPVVVTACDAGLVDRPPLPTAMAVAPDGTLFVADAGQGTIWRVGADGRDVEPWLTELGWASPAGGVGPSGLAFDGAGTLVVVLEATLTDDRGAVYLVERTDDGDAGRAVELARTEPGARPAAVAVADSGRLYVPLRAAGRVLVLEPDGSEARRLADQPAIDTPAGIAFAGTDLLVTAQSPSDASKGHVVRLGAGEAGR